jgi:hypothetical protein
MIYVNRYITRKRLDPNSPENSRHLVYSYSFEG